MGEYDVPGEIYRMNQANNKHDKNLNSHSIKATSSMLIIGIIFISANLRAPLTSVGPLVSFIRDSLHISNTLAGMITTLPLFAFALFSPFAPVLARKFGARLVLFWSIVFLTLGIVLRSLSGSIGLFIGTAILGLAIAVCNVLIPSLIKQEFSERVGFMTGIFSVSMSTFGAIASGISIPIAVGLGVGWAGTLSIWAVLSCIAVVIWIPHLKQCKNQGNAIIQETENSKVETNTFRVHQEIQTTPIVQGMKSERTNLWKSPLAWQVTVFMGLQSLLFYTMIAWVPDILIQQGMNSGNAGLMLSLLQLVGIPCSFIASIVAGRKASQYSLVITSSLCVITGIIGLLFEGSGFAFLWMILIGSGGGISFSLAMMFFSLRTRNADEAVRLSGMAQSFGYLLAAIGPMLFGFLHDQTGSWTIPLVILIGLAFINFLVGLGGARNVYVSSPEKQIR